MKARRRLGRSLNFPRTFTSPDALADFLLSIGGGHVVQILHIHESAECTRVRCVCSPTFEVREGSPANLVEGVRMEQHWLRSVAS